MEQEEFDQMLNDLEADGCITRKDEQIFVNWELLELLHPALHDVFDQALVEEIDEAIKVLCDSGYMEMSFREQDGQLEAVYRLTSKGEAYVEAMK